MSEGECPLEEWVGLDTFRFCGATDLSADPGGSGTEYIKIIVSSHNRSQACNVQCIYSQHITQA